MLTKILRISLGALLLAVASCRTIPDAHRIEFELEGSIDKPLLYLETADEGVVTIRLTPDDEVAEEAHYHVVSCTCPEGSLLTDEKGQPVAAGTFMASGEHTFTYRPATAGLHNLELVVADAWGDSEQRCSLSVTVAEEREISFSAQLKVQGVAASTSQVSLLLSIQDKEDKHFQEQWQITSWSLTGGLEGKLDESSLKHGNNSLKLLLTPFALTGSPQLTMVVTGPLDKSLPLAVSLSPVCSELLRCQLKQLADQTATVKTKARQALRGTPGEASLKRCHEQQTGSRKQLEDTLKQLRANLTVLNDDSMNEEIQRLEGGAQREMNEALADLSKTINHFSRFTRGINATDSYGDLPLHDAVSWEDLPLVRFLLPRTYYINVENNEGETALDKAKPYSDIYYLLRQHGACVGVDGQVQERFDRGVNDYDSQKRTPLIEAAMDEDQEALELLLSHPKLEIDKGEIDNYGNESTTALMWAVIRGNLRLVKLLVQAGANININCYITSPTLIEGEGNFFGPPDPPSYDGHEKRNHTALYYAVNWKNALSNRGQNASAYRAIERYLLDRGARVTSIVSTYHDSAYYRSGKWRTSNWLRNEVKSGREVVY